MEYLVKSKRGYLTRRNNEYYFSHFAGGIIWRKKETAEKYAAHFGGEVETREL